MKRFSLATILLLTSSAAFAHPNGTYQINADVDATVTFTYLERCGDEPGALSGGLRSLTFSETAQGEPYLFVSGYYVEEHREDGEVYIQTDEQCVPLIDGGEIHATRDTFNGYALQRI